MKDQKTAPRSQSTLAESARPGTGQTRDAATWATARRSLDALLAQTIRDSSATYGYAATAMSFGETFEVTLEKDGTSFVLWVKPASDQAPCYRQTTRFKVGHRGHPTDRLGYALLDIVCAQIEAWEKRLVEGGAMGQATPPTSPEAPSMDDTIQRVLSEATFSPIYDDWLEVREQQLAAYFAGLEISGRKNILLVNATKGLQFYPSIVDFFALLQRTCDAVRVTATSYFANIIQFQQEVADKGLEVVPVTDVLTWDAAALNRFDAIIVIGACDALATFMACDGLTAKLVLLDLGFFHQLMEAYPGWYPGACIVNRDRIIANEPFQKNRVAVYSCQPQEKLVKDLTGACNLRLLDWHWINYIPIGFTYSTYYRADRYAFDVALLGSSQRKYEEIDPARFAGRRFLFLGMTQDVPEIERLRQQLDLTIVSRVDEDVYARLLALCRCVVLPYHGRYAYNVFMSVIDTVASGKPLVTTRHAGLERLERAGLPALFYDTTPGDLFQKVDALLALPERLQDIGARSIAFAQEQLDIYGALKIILEEQIR